MKRYTKNFWLICLKCTLIMQLSLGITFAESPPEEGDPPEDESPFEGETLSEDELFSLNEDVRAMLDFYTIDQLVDKIKNATVVLLIRSRWPSTIAIYSQKDFFAEEKMFELLAALPTENRNTILRIWLEIEPGSKPYFNEFFFGFSKRKLPDSKSIFYKEKLKKIYKGLLKGGGFGDDITPTVYNFLNEINLDYQEVILPVIIENSSVDDLAEKLYYKLNHSLLAKIWNDNFEQRDESIIEYILDQEYPKPLAEMFKNDTLLLERKIKIISSPLNFETAWQIVKENYETHEDELIEQWYTIMGDIFSHKAQHQIEESGEVELDYILKESEVTELLNGLSQSNIEKVFNNINLIEDIDHPAIIRWARIFFSRSGIRSEITISLLKSETINTKNFAILIETVLSEEPNLSETSELSSDLLKLLKDENLGKEALSRIFVHLTSESVKNKIIDVIPEIKPCSSQENPGCMGACWRL